MALDKEERFAVRIRIGGMCLFVPQQSRHVMHVLMPKMTAGTHAAHADGGHGTHHHTLVAHSAVLAYDVAYETPRSPGLTRNMRVHKLGGAAATIGAKLGDEPAFSLPREVVRLGKEFCFDGVRSAHVTPAGAQALTARVELRAGRAPNTTATDPREVCFADAKGRQKGCRTVAHYVPWMIDGVEGGSLALGSLIEVTSLAGGAFGIDLAVLHPIDGVVELTILHAIDAAIPVDGGPMPSDLGPAPDHFPGYYTLSKKTDCGPVTARMKEGYLPTAVCMTAQAELSA